MPRKARVKSTESVYHIMCRSISESLLFRVNDDKDYYLSLLKRYLNKNHCSLYAYCLMDNHLHLHLDPRGFDISKFMQSLNTAYVRYYNKKYKRRGPIFQDRFESRILNTDAYNYAVSAYIHNNPHDINGFANKEEYYPYSSYGIYAGIRKDKYMLIDKSFMMALYNISNEKTFINKYTEFVRHQRDTGNYHDLKENLSSAVENEYISGRTVILRDFDIDKVITFISDKLKVAEVSSISIKSKFIKYRAFVAYVLRVLCGLGYSEICSNMYNITVSGCANLCNKGYELLNRDPVYVKIFNELINSRV